MRRPPVLAAALAASALAAAAVRAQAPSPADAAAREASPGRAVFDANCAACHLHPESVRAPALAVLHALPAGQIRFALTEGVMRQQGGALSPADREAVVAYLAAPATGAARAEAAAVESGAWVDPLRCPAGARGVDLPAEPAVASAGIGPANTRRMSAAQAGLSAADFRRLEVAWTLPLPQTTTLRATGPVAGTTLFYPAPQLGTVLALDTRTGCVKWARHLARQLRASPALGRAGDRPALFVPDALGTVHALDPRDGSELWAADPRPDKTTPITGGLVYAAGRVIVPVSASDVGRAGDPKYACCTSHGAVAALDAATGRLLWATPTTAAATPTGRRSSAGVELWGPSGAPVWATPTVDLQRGLVYVGVGENTSLPATDTSDSVMALDLATGARRWTFQSTPGDVWNIACHKAGHPNCDFAAAESIRRDWDFGMSPMIVRRGGRDLLVVGQKSGHVYALDPATGRPAWTRRFGTGTSLGGVHWGMATDGVRAFVPINDPVIDTGDSAAAGLYAVDAATGALRWSYAARPDCGGGRGERVPSCTTRYGLSAAPLAVGDAVVAGRLDGWLRVWDGRDGRELYAFDTARTFPERGGVAGRGGAIDSQSIFAGDGALFVGSGYGAFSEAPGNVLIAFRPRR